jgi:hypothetical protein
VPGFYDSSDDDSIDLSDPTKKRARGTCDPVDFYFGKNADVFLLSGHATRRHKIDGQDEMHFGREEFQLFTLEPKMKGKERPIYIITDDDE